MEVASPLTFGHNAAGTKRHLPCSPGFVDSTNRSPFPRTGFEAVEDYCNQRSFKRRRFTADDAIMDSGSENSTHAPLLPFTPQQKSVFHSTNTGSSFKRCRTEALSPPHELHRMVESQAAEIQNLKTDKSNIESSLNLLKGENEKLSNENRILKRAVTIQQERQNHAVSEIEAAKQYKVNAEDRIRKLEQLILSLRYHLQAQQHNAGNDFMGFPPRPPDVY